MAKAVKVSPVKTSSDTLFATPGANGVRWKAVPVGLPVTGRRWADIWTLKEGGPWEVIVKQL